MFFRSILHIQIIDIQYFIKQETLVNLLINSSSEYQYYKFLPERISDFLDRTHI